MLRKIKPVLLLILLLGRHEANSAVSDLSEYSKLKRLSDNQKRTMVIRLSGKFLNRFPGSRYVPDVHLLIAENILDTDDAIKKYRMILNNYRDYNKSDYALFRICEILSLVNRWAELRNESSFGINKFKKSIYNTEYRFFHILSGIRLHRYYEAEKECRDIIENDHRYNNMSRALKYLSLIRRKTSGMSRSYIYSLRELAMGFKKSKVYPAAIYLIGNFYEKRGDFNRAYSAYHDLIIKYPKSIERNFAERKIIYLHKYNPVKMKYIPDDKIINSTGDIEISPVVNPENGEGDFNSYYAISIGPFPTLKKAKKIKFLLKEFGNSKTARTRYGYTLIIGSLKLSDDAFSLKIRLAEEFGINGRIIRVSGKDRKKYIHGE